MCIEVQVFIFYIDMVLTQADDRNSTIIWIFEHSASVGFIQVQLSDVQENTYISAMANVDTQLIIKSVTMSDGECKSTGKWR